MSLLSDFESYKTRLNNEIANICAGKLLDETYQEIFKQADAVVYSYGSKGERRGSLKNRENYKDKYYQSGGTHTIEIETNLTFQGTPWSPDLAVVIDEGYPNFHQPYSRPWMWVAEDMMRDKAQDIVTSELIARGL